METRSNSVISPAENSSQKRKISDEMQASIDEELPNLPGEIIGEILARLPVKSLLKFRCVSKSWRSLISSPSFAKLHLQIATKDSTFSSYRIMLTFCDPVFNLKHCSVRSLMCEHTADVFEIDYPKKHAHRPVWVVGTCNGLICIAIKEKDLYLWNPSTRSTAKIPPVEVKLKPGFYNIFGFGYSELSNDYKVLGMFFVFGTSGVYESVVKMYSHKTNSWKTIEGFKSGFPIDESGKLVNGKLHFGMIPDPALGSVTKRDIVSIALDSEAWGVVEQPNYGEGEFDSSLGVLRGCICVCIYLQEHFTDFWVMKEYGVKESWTKVAAITCTLIPERFLYFKPLYMLPSGEVLFMYGKHLAIYNLKDSAWTHPQINNFSSFLDADPYVESLVSPVVNETKEANNNISNVIKKIKVI